MPSIIPSYLYTFFALTLVGTILIGTFGSFAVSLKKIPEEKMLKNIVDYVAAESMELINYITTVGGEATVEAFLNIPSTINHKQYWLRLNTNSKYAFIEAGFGAIPTQARFKIYLPAEVSASGEIISGFGKVLLTCQRIDSGIYLSLDYLEG